MRGGCINPLIHKAEDVEKVSFMVTETMGKGDEQLPITGLVVIIDMDGLTLEHLTNRSLSLSKKLMKFYQVVRNLIIGMLCFANFIHFNCFFLIVKLVQNKSIYDHKI